MYYVGISTYHFLPYYISAIHNHMLVHILKPFEDSKLMGLKVDTAQCVYTELCTVQEKKCLHTAVSWVLCKETMGLHKAVYCVRKQCVYIQLCIVYFVRKQCVYIQLCTVHGYSVFTITQSCVPCIVHGNSGFTITQSCVLCTVHGNSVFTITQSGVPCTVQGNSLFTITQSIVPCIVHGNSVFTITQSCVPCIVQGNKQLKLDGGGRGGH